MRAFVSFALAGYFPPFQEYVWLRGPKILRAHAAKNRREHDVACFLCLNNYLTI